MDILSAIVAFFMSFFPSPDFGQGIQQLSPFFTTAGRVQLSSTTAGFRVPSLASLDCIGTDADGDFEEGTCTGGGGGSGDSFAWDVTDYGVSTSTTLGFLNGFLSTASSTQVGDFHLGGASQVFAPDGSASDPSYSFSNDTNVGIFRGGTDTLGLAAATAVTIAQRLQHEGDDNTYMSFGNDSLNWTIGGVNFANWVETTQNVFNFNPSSADIDFNVFDDNGVKAFGVTGSDGLLTFGAYDCSGNANGGALTVDASGNVVCSDDTSGSGGSGLATSTAIADTEIIYATSANDVGSEAAFTYNDATNLMSVGSAAVSATTTSGAVQAGSTAIGNNVFKVSPLTGLTTSNSESTGGVANFNTETTDALGFAMYTNNSGSQRLLSLVSDHASYGGNVLHVRSDGTTSAVNVLGAPTGQGIVKVGSNDTGDANASVLSLDASTSGFLGQLWFGKCGSNTKCWNIRDASNNETMTFLADGNLGIGTTSPYARLSVAGETVSGWFTATSTTATSSVSRLNISNALTLGAEFITSLTGAALHLINGELNTAATISPQPVKQQPDFMHENMDSGWTNWYGGGTAVHDTSIYVEGNGSIQIPTASAAATNVGMRKNITDVNFSRAAFHFWVRSDNWAEVTDAEILISTSGTFSQFYTIDLKDFLVSPEDDGWIEVVVARSNFENSGSANWATANDMIVRARSTEGNTPTVWFDGFGANDSGSRGVVSITFDDAWADTATTSKPIMDKYGFKGSACVTHDAIGTTEEFMTQKMVDDLATAGWDICGHGGTNLTTLSAEEAEADLIAMKAYLVNHGYQGGNIYAWPNGAVTEALASTTAKYFDVARNVTWLRQSPNYISRSQLNAVSPSNNTSTSTIYTMIDSAVENGEWLILNFHHVVPTADESDEYSTLGFSDVMDYLDQSGVEVLPVSRVFANDYTPTRVPTFSNLVTRIRGMLGIDTTSGQLRYHDGTATRVIVPTYYSSFVYSTSTAWTGTTTIPLGPAPIAETWGTVKCFTDTGTLNVSFSDATNRMNLFNASTTVGTVSFSSNNSFTSSEKRYVDIGTPASSPTKISCTVGKAYDAD